MFPYTLLAINILKVEWRLFRTYRVTVHTALDVRRYFRYCIEHNLPKLEKKYFALITKNPRLQALLQRYGKQTEPKSILINLLSEYLIDSLLMKNNPAPKIFSRVFDDLCRYYRELGHQEDFKTLCTRINRINPSLFNDSKKLAARTNTATLKKVSQPSIEDVRWLTEKELIETLCHHVFTVSPLSTIPLQNSRWQQQDKGQKKLSPRKIDDSVKARARTGDSDSMLQLASWYDKSHTLLPKADRRLLANIHNKHRHCHLDLHVSYWLMRALIQCPSAHIFDRLVLSITKKINHWDRHRNPLEMARWQNAVTQLQLNQGDFVKKQLLFFSPAIQSFKNAYAESNYMTAAKHLARIFQDSLKTPTDPENQKIVCSYLSGKLYPFLSDINFNGDLLSEDEIEPLNHIFRILTPTPWPEIKQLLQDKLKHYEKYTDAQVIINEIKSNLKTIPDATSTLSAEVQFSECLMEILLRHHYLTGIGRRKRKIIFKLWQILDDHFDLFIRQNLEVFLDHHFQGFSYTKKANAILIYHQVHRSMVEDLDPRGSKIRYLS